MVTVESFIFVDITFRVFSTKRFFVNSITLFLVLCPCLVSLVYIA